MEEYSWLKNILEQEIDRITDKQKAIIKSAVELFSEKGYAATSTREIAKKAGVAEGSIFKLFPTKKDLMLWITERIIDTALFPMVTSGISELLEKNFKNREEFLSAFLQNRMALMQEGVPLFKIIIQEIPFQPEVRVMLLEQFNKLPFNMLAEKLGAMETQSGLGETDTVKIIITCITGFLFLRNIMLPELFPKSRIKEDAAALARFMSRGLGSEKERDL
ncbi:MAG: TetR/AcrR family transcriptional regulator [Treponema sp.]|nr:TetR/AcrR family transcriptional regulator [Treponema sp.]MCL2271455.1 TetR/AcrR family transcriptional regulator [Treponema sp.]